MSAFICGPDHFKALAVFAAIVKARHISPNVDPRYVKGLEKISEYRGEKLASAYADILYAENVRSVLHRYPNDTLDSAPGPMEKPEHIRVSMRDMVSPAYRLRPLAILKMCDCLDYQSCETDDWEDTPAYRLLNSIRRAAIRELPGYDGAPWDYEASRANAA